MAERTLFAKLRKREMIHHSLQSNIQNLGDDVTLKKLNREVFSSRILLKNINQEILLELRDSQKLDESLLVAGVEFKTLVEIDDFEYEYLNSCE